MTNFLEHGSDTAVRDEVADRVEATVADTHALSDIVVLG
jgi:hypothetical protein